MALKLNPNSGIAFRNDRGLERSEKAPQFKGEAMFEGKRIEIAVWERKTKNGATMLCFNLQDAVASQLERLEKRKEYLEEIVNAGK